MYLFPDGKDSQPNAGDTDPTVSDPQQLSLLLKAPPADFLDCYPVSRQINSVRFDEPRYAKEIALDYTGLLQNANQE